MQLKDKKVLVVGLGVSGVAVCKFLVAEGAEVSATDSADSVPCADELSGIGVELELGGHDPSVVDGCDLVVASPGVPDEALPLVLAADKGIPVIGELELGARFARRK